MDKTGVALLVVGLILAGAGVYGMTQLAPEVIAFLIGIVELVVAVIGLGFIVIGAIMAKD
ncbi:MULTISPECIES: hypothetical protein [Methanofollis]|jgi:hypothetical protein|uniref:hypothetical protein n=1 Tax=Methanofollis TaxID=81416 RepID=UPI00128F9974|nr:hypothetical protein [Methanofollis ethanolicus]